MFTEFNDESWQNIKKVLRIKYEKQDVVGIWDMCPRGLMMDRGNKREQIASRDREKNHYASEKNNL